jgi:hypothetical protein
MMSTQRGGGVANDEDDDDERWRRGEKKKSDKGTKTRTRLACARAFFITLSLSLPPSTLPTFHGIFHPRGTCAASLCWLDENVDESTLNFTDERNIRMKNSAFSRRFSSIASSALNFPTTYR